MGFDNLYSRYTTMIKLVLWLKCYLRFALTGHQSWEEIDYPSLIVFWLLVLGATLATTAIYLGGFAPSEGRVTFVDYISLMPISIVFVSIVHAFISHLSKD